MMTLDEVVEKLKNVSAKPVSDATGLHYNSVRAIRDGRNDDPKLSTLKALSDYFEKN